MPYRYLDRKPIDIKKPGPTEKFYIGCANSLTVTAFLVSLVTMFVKAVQAHWFDCFLFAFMTAALFVAILVAFAQGPDN